ncbi:GtrA family protein [Humibacter sp. RRB41]|uniref:GtrA family protein n=1 Tax=Humibacter sp. RRB41 TaxID=2919946 RepID=UPI001FA95520|nr:GtrA family protein [Humibacter sp. RRB41]
MLTDRGATETAADHDAQRVSEASATPRGLLLKLVTDQRVAFLIVGAFNTVLGWALFTLAQQLIGVHLGRFGYMVSLYLSYAVAILCAFFLHRYFVFRVRGHFWLDLARFTVVNLAGLGLNTVLLPLVIETTGTAPVIAQGCVALAVAVISYGGHKYFSFRRTKKHDAVS